MPVCHEKRFVFLHVPKTAGVSVRRAFARANLTFEMDGEASVWPRLLAHPNNGALVRRLKAVYPLNTLVGFGEPHLPASVLYDLCVPDVRPYFSFGFVRNPWDVVVSTYAYWRTVFAQQPELGRNDPDYAFMLSACTEFAAFVRVYPMFSADMTSFLIDERGAMPDFVGRTECLEADFAVVCRRVGVNAFLEHDNTSERGPYRDYYTAETRAIVARHFARDIAAFGYEF